VLRQELADGLFEGEVGHGMLDALQRLARDRVEARLVKVWARVRVRVRVGVGLRVRVSGLG
tara:strand:+ start:313 stop:495 length:183 start_codon:yes stop_codon:yes gene_type:complete